MSRIVHYLFIICLMAPVGHAMDSPQEFDERTLQELVTGADTIFRTFGVNNLNLPQTTLFIQNQIIPKHSHEMYTLWKNANNWENAGIGALEHTRNGLQNSIAAVSSLSHAKSIIKGKLKNKGFLLLQLTEEKLKEKVLLTAQNGRMKIEKDLTGVGYDIIFQYKFSDNVGVIQEKSYEQLQDRPTLTNARGAKVLVVVIGMYDFLGQIWALTQRSGMTTEREVLALSKEHPGRIKSIYALQDYRS